MCHKSGLINIGCPKTDVLQLAVLDVAPSCVTDESTHSAGIWPILSHITTFLYTSVFYLLSISASYLPVMWPSYMALVC